MKLDSSTRNVFAILGVVAIAVAFWMLLLGPKRKEADELSTKVEGLQATLTESRNTVAEAEQARKDFPTNYRQLVVLGKAVPANDETASLLVQLNHVADSAHVSFNSIQLGTATGSASTETEASAPAAAEAGGTTGSPASLIAPTEAEAALLPLGASIGPDGVLNVLPYDLSFTGNFFQVADFIKGIDGLVHTGGAKVAVDGRLVTLDGFSLTTNSEEGLSGLKANFSVTTYMVPPGQGLTAGATPGGPAGAAETAEATGEATEATGEESTEEATPTASETEPQ